jgi:hypothetical protein
MKTPQEFLRYAMQCARGDDLERATAAFKHLSDEQLDKEYGQSGQTCRQILDGYKKRRKEWNAANRCLEKLLQ